MSFLCHPIIFSPLTIIIIEFIHHPFHPTPIIIPPNHFVITNRFNNLHHLLIRHPSITITLVISHFVLLVVISRHIRRSCHPRAFVHVMRLITFIQCFCCYWLMLKLLVWLLFMCFLFIFYFLHYSFVFNPPHCLYSSYSFFSHLPLHIHPTPPSLIIVSTIFSNHPWKFFHVGQLHPIIL